MAFNGPVRPFGFAILHTIHLEPAPGPRFIDIAHRDGTVERHEFIKPQTCVLIKNVVVTPKHGPDAKG